MSQKLSPPQEAGIGPLQRSAPTLHPHSPNMICLWSHLQPGFKTPFGHLPPARYVLTTQMELGVPLLTSHRICCSPVRQLPTPSLFPCLSLPRGQASVLLSASWAPSWCAGSKGLSLNIWPRLVLLLSGAPYTPHIPTLTEYLFNTKERAVDLGPSPTSGTLKYFRLQSPISKMEVMQAPHWL